MPQPTCIPSLETPTISLPETKFVMPDIPNLNPDLQKYLSDMSSSYGNIFTQYNKSIQSMIDSIKQNNSVVQDRLQSVYQYLFNPENVEMNNLSTNNLDTITINHISPVEVTGSNSTISPPAIYSVPIPVAGAGFSHYIIDLKTYGAETGAKFVFVFLYLGWDAGGTVNDDLVVAIQPADDAHSYFYESGSCRLVGNVQKQNGASIFVPVNTDQETCVTIALGAGSVPVNPTARLYAYSSVL